MQIYIFLGILKEIKYKLSLVLPIKYYNEYFALNISAIFTIACILNFYISHKGFS